MFSSIDIWEVLAGVAIFMLGSNFMDESLRALAGRRFKLFLKKQTGHKLRAVTGGFFFSGVLQSSSIVNLLILSFAGAGVINLANALAVILGSNLGSTATNWLVASLGFDFGVEKLAFPVAGITGIAIAFITNGTRIYHWCRLLFGFSFLFIGIGFIKSGMADLIAHTDLSSFNNFPLIIFAVAGFMITTLVQSSAATVALILSSLYVHAISLPAAMAVLLGSEAGTTIKLFLASGKGNPVKKRIALGNLLFNLAPAALFIALIPPSYTFITSIIGIQNELYALIFFQTIVNLGGIMLFYPFLEKFGQWLTGKFTNNKPYLLEIDSNKSSDNSIASFTADTETFIHLVLRFCKSAVHITDPDNSSEGTEKLFSKNITGSYAILKTIHGELHNYYTRKIKEEVSTIDERRLEQLIACVRNGLYASKSIRDAIKDIGQLYNSANDAKYNFYLQAREKIRSFCNTADAILDRNSAQPASAISGLYEEIQHSYDKSLKKLYSADLGIQLDEQEISTLVNFNRETYTAFKSILFALKDYLLEGKAAEDFENRPGFIH